MQIRRRPGCRRSRRRLARTQRRPDLLDCAAMKHSFLRFCEDPQPDLALPAGVQALGRASGGQLAPVDQGADWLLQLSNDRRGIWMTVAEGLRGVHVNGRPVHQVAMLRAGDSIHVDGRKLQLCADVDTRAPTESAPQQDPAAKVRLVLRGVGGRHHGRGLGLDRPCRIGSAEASELRIEGPGIQPQHAVIDVVNGQVVLRAIDVDVLVNGQPVREATLHGGDQIAFGTQHRFVLEAPAAPVPPASHPELDAAPLPPQRGWASRVPWLLVAAALLAIGLSALLAFGQR